MKKILISIFILASPLIARAQVMSLDDAVSSAVKYNPGLRATASNVEAQRQLKRTSFDLPKTDVTFMQGQYNSYERADNNITISQSIPFTAFGSQGAYNRANITSAELKKVQSENELTYQVKQVYYHLSYLKARRKLLVQQDSLFEGFYKSASLRFKTGEAKLLEQSTAESQRNESKNALFQVEADILVLREQLKALINSRELPDTPTDVLLAIPFVNIPDSSSLRSNPSLASSNHDVRVADAERKLAAARFVPDLRLGYFNQTLIGISTPDFSHYATKSERFTGVQVGLSIPLWFVPHQARVKSARYATQAAQSKYEEQLLQVNANFQQALREYDKNKESLEYYEKTGLPNAELIIKQSKLAFREGEADYAEYLLGVRNALNIQENYLRTLNNCNQTIIYLEFLTGNK
jgi:cobalt-zinc-cadmium resistance protein CzcA